MVDNITMWEQALPMLVTLVLSLLMQTRWSGTTKRYVAVAASVVAAVADLYIRGNLNPTDFVGLFLLTFLGSQGFYLLFRDKLTSLSQATDLS